MIYVGTVAYLSEDRSFNSTLKNATFLKTSKEELLRELNPENLYILLGRMNERIKNPRFEETWAP